MTEAKHTNQGLKNIEKFLQMMPTVISRYKRRDWRLFRPVIAQALLNSDLLEPGCHGNLRLWQIYSKQGADYAPTLLLPPSRIFRPSYKLVYRYAVITKTWQFLPSLLHHQVVSQKPLILQSIFKC